MKYYQRFLGRELSLQEGVDKLLDADKEVRSQLPAGAIVVPQTRKIHAACYLDLANGSRLVLQYEIQTDTTRADLTLQYEEP